MKQEGESVEVDEHWKADRPGSWAFRHTFPPRHITRVLLFHTRQDLLFLASSRFAAGGPLGLESNVSTISQLSACTQAAAEEGHYLCARTACT